jgi:hypothetical protein
MGIRVELDINLVETSLVDCIFGPIDVALPMAKISLRYTNLNIGLLRLNQNTCTVFVEILELLLNAQVVFHDYKLLQKKEIKKSNSILVNL